MAVTIKDVAALAGVSPSTVSRVCNDHPSISAETRERVRNAMSKLGYEPNTSAQQADQRLRMISVLLPPSPKEAYENSFYLQVIRGISQVCNQRQVACSVITGKDTAEMLQALQAMSQSRQNDGFILLYSRKDDPVVDYLCEQGLLYSCGAQASHRRRPCGGGKPHPQRRKKRGYPCHGGLPYRHGRFPDMGGGFPSRKGHRPHKAQGFPQRILP